jgi:GTP-binding protein Era
MTKTGRQHSGYVALIGRTNVGKSTFLNHILETKVSIVSPSPQTTREQILGIKTVPRGQIVFFDSPGVHKPHFKLNEKMMKAVHHSLMDADIILYFVEIGDKREDEFILNLIEKLNKTTFLIINKIDKSNKARILTQIDQFMKQYAWSEIIPLSALRGDNIDRLEDLIFQYLPEGEHIFPPEEYTRQTEKYYIAELIREKILNMSRQELPFTTGVMIQEITERERVFYIRADIYVETLGQKKIIVGKHGSLVKQIGETARIDIEDYFNKKVFLDLFVRIVPNWRNSPHVLHDIFD